MTEWRQLGLTGWSADEVFSVFKRLDNHFLGDSEFHGTQGEWRVEAQRLRWDVLEAVREAAMQMGIPAISDFNRGDNEGVSYFHVNQKKGLRVSAARAFLKPALGRPNLRLVMHANIDRVLFDGRRAAGIRFVQNGRTFEARAKGEVILSSGSIGSVEIMQRSGVGPGSLLQSLGIPVIKEHDGVGGNLQDHLQQRMIYKVSGVKTLNQIYYSLLGKAMMGAEYALFRTGPLTMAPSQLGIFTRSDATRDRANIQFHVQPLVAGQVRRSAAPLSRDHGERLQSSAHLAGTGADLRSAGFPRQAFDQAQLPGHAGRPRSCRRRHPRDPPADGATGADEIPPRGISARTRSRTTLPILPRPQAISAPPSSIRSAPRRWASPPTPPPWWMSGCE